MTNEIYGDNSLAYSRQEHRDFIKNLTVSENSAHIGPDAP